MIACSRFQLLRNPQRKCNCCFQWCDVKSDLTATFFSCDTCTQRLLTNGISTQSPDGSSYRLILLEEKQWDDICHPTSCSLDYEVSQKPQDTQLGWSKVHSGLDDQDFAHEQFSSSVLHQIDQKYSNHQNQVYNCRDKRENLLILMNDQKNCGNKTILDIPSLDLPSFQQSQGRTYQSGIYSNKELINLKNKRSQNHLRHSNLEDYSRNLQATRIVKGYQYYYNLSEIKRHKQNKRQGKTRQFGDQISPCKLSQFYSKETSAKKAECLKLKFNRSIISQNSSQSLSRLSEDELKARILTFLETKGHSITMNRFISRYVREAYVRTNIYGKTIELISFKITHMDLLCYLSLFDFDLANTLKLINVGLTDSQVPVLAQFVSNKPIQRLVLTGNTFTQNTVSAFLSRPFPCLKELYLGKNRINKYRIKENITELKSRFVLYI